MRLGEYDVRNTEELAYQDLIVKDVIVHGDFHSGTLANDIALLITAEPARLSGYVRPVCLPPYHDYSDYHCTVTGWGKNAPGKSLALRLIKCD